MEALFSIDGLLALISLTAMEIVLGIDNVVFVAILVARLPEAERERIRRLGIGLALGLRLALLFALTWLMGLTEPLFAAGPWSPSGRDLILLVGGLFLMGKSANEIYEKVEGPAEEHAPGAAGKTGAAMTVLAQILAIDVVFSLDSVITAVGMAQHLAIMVCAMVIAVGVMLLSARAVGDFVERHPSMKILALSFLLLIGVLLVAESLGQHVSKGYVYFAMAFSLLVELVNMRLRKRRAQPVQLHGKPARD